ncbi:MAG: hypothetical protein JXR81_10100 [Candidatus Goldbacteria bacterium]|nr:hypothetical protein [Candidatus Goldiibacteriota bacterium]
MRKTLLPLIFIFFIPTFALPSDFTAEIFFNTSGTKGISADIYAEIEDSAFMITALYSFSSVDTNAFSAGASYYTSINDIFSVLGNYTFYTGSTYYSPATETAAEETGYPVGLISHGVLILPSITFDSLEITPGASFAVDTVSYPVLNENYTGRRADSEKNHISYTTTAPELSASYYFEDDFTAAISGSYILYSIKPADIYDAAGATLNVSAEAASLDAAVSFKKYSAYASFKKKFDPLSLALKLSFKEYHIPEAGHYIFHSYSANIKAGYQFSEDMSAEIRPEYSFLRYSDNSTGNNLYISLSVTHKF